MLSRRAALSAFVALVLLLNHVVFGAASSAEGVNELSATILAAPAAERALVLDILRRKVARHPRSEERSSISCKSHEFEGDGGSASFIELAGSVESPLSGLMRALTGGKDAKQEGAGVRHNRALLKENGGAKAGDGQRLAERSLRSGLGAARDDPSAPPSTSSSPSSAASNQFPGNPPIPNPTLGCSCEDYDCTCSHNCQCKVSVDKVPAADGTANGSSNSTLGFMPSSLLINGSPNKPVLPDATRNPGHMFRCDCRFSVEGGPQHNLDDGLTCGCEPEACSCKRKCTCPNVKQSSDTTNSNNNDGAT